MPKILFFDIETSPILGYVWSIWNQNIGLNQINQDWHILSFAAKWRGSSKIIYFDQRGEKSISNDKSLCEKLWKLIDEADVVVTQNGDKFDIKKINSRFVIHGLKPPSSFKSIDTVKIARNKFGFTSNKLEYLSSALGLKEKKSKHSEFPGFDLWLECLKGNKKAWKEMEKYNIQDVLALERLWEKLDPWAKTVNATLYNKDLSFSCICGSKEYILNGLQYKSTGIFKRYKCKKCGKAYEGATNLINKKDKKKLIK